MKNLTIVSTEKGCIKFTQMPSSYLISIDESDDIIFVNFIDAKTKDVLHPIIVHVADDEPERDFKNYMSKGKEKILTLMRSQIKEDLIQFLSEERDEDYYTFFPLEHTDAFVSEEFAQRWREFYDDFIDLGVVSDEFFAPLHPDHKE